MEARSRKLQRWFEGGGVLFVGYEMFRNLVLGKRLRTKKREAFEKYLLDPGTVRETSDISRHMHTHTYIHCTYTVPVYRCIIAYSTCLCTVTFIYFSGPDIIVCDEGHVMRNASSHLSMVLQRVRTLTRIVLTGTPLQNNLVECE